MNKIISCDWGTSNFRLRLAESHSAEIIAELVVDDGIASVFNDWKISGAARESFYADVLSRHISSLQANTTTALKGLPVVISGMASSSLGIRELPYANLPFGADGSGATFARLFVGAFEHEIILVSGVASASDVMRGEETQWLGLMHQLNVAAARDLLFVLPGTHSKHIQVQDGAITGFRTFMTGEFFNLLSTHSVLKNSVSVIPGFRDSEDENAFIAGVEASAGSNLLHESFIVRTNDLFRKYTVHKNAFYLSGLLIGSEVRDAAGQVTVLAAGTSLLPLYERAFKHLSIAKELFIISPAQSDAAIVIGQSIIFKQIR
jgi:2-dehydro-3-deoxygalactonokinase